MTAPCARRILALAPFQMFGGTEATQGRASPPDFRIATERTAICSSPNMFSLHQLTACVVVSGSRLLDVRRRRRSAQLLFQFDEPGILGIGRNRVAAANGKASHLFIVVERIGDHAPDT